MMTRHIVPNEKKTDHVRHHFVRLKNTPITICLFMIVTISYSSTIGKNVKACLELHELHVNHSQKYEKMFCL